jgi:hypothetical protein
VREYYWITDPKVKEAIATFSPMKREGPDGIKPIILQNIPEAAITRLTWIFSACITVQYISRSWCNAEMIFLPKPGKEDYSIPKSFRPISLLNFVFKAFEKLNLWFLEETHLAAKPIHSHQHGFRRGYSTESALIKVVNRLEKQCLNGKVALGLFLDVEGAFDNVKPDYVLRVMERRGMPQEFLGWYAHFLKSREIYIEIKGVNMVRIIVNGYPQGDVLSPVSWDITAEEWLDAIEASQTVNGKKIDHAVEAEAFADDTEMDNGGPNLAVLIKPMQLALNASVEWATKAGLVLSRSKTVAIVFSRCKSEEKITATKSLTIYGTAIKYSENTRYLGVQLDNKLKWHYHIKLQVAKCKRILNMTRARLGKTWGPAPALMKWAYTACVRPIFSYGCLVWGKTLTKNTKCLKNLQRTASAPLCGNIKRTTPGDALEVILYLPPLDLFIKGELLRAALRNKSHLVSTWKHKVNKPIGVIAYCDAQLREFQLQDCPYDETLPTLNLAQNYTVDYESFEDGTVPTEPLTLQVFTDGSKMDQGSGYGNVILYQVPRIPFEPPEHESNSYPAGPDATVFQAEAAAIGDACIDIANHLTTSNTSPPSLFT